MASLGRGFRAPSGESGNDRLSIVQLFSSQDRASDDGDGFASLGRASSARSKLTSNNSRSVSGVRFRGSSVEPPRSVKQHQAMNRSASWEESSTRVVSSNKRSISNRRKPPSLARNHSDASPKSFHLSRKEKGKKKLHRSREEVRSNREDTRVLEALTLSSPLPYSDTTGTSPRSSSPSSKGFDTCDEQTADKKKSIIVQSKSNEMSRFLDALEDAKATEDDEKRPSSSKNKKTRKALRKRSRSNQKRGLLDELDELNRVLDTRMKKQTSESSPRVSSPPVLEPCDHEDDIARWLSEGDKSRNVDASSHSDIECISYGKGSSSQYPRSNVKKPDQKKKTRTSSIGRAFARRFAITREREKETPSTPAHAEDRIDRTEKLVQHRVSKKSSSSPGLHHWLNTWSSDVLDLCDIYDDGHRQSVDSDDDDNNGDGGDGNKRIGVRRNGPHTNHRIVVVPTEDIFCVGVLRSPTRSPTASQEIVPWTEDSSYSQGGSQELSSASKSIDVAERLSIPHHHWDKSESIGSTIVYKDQAGVKDYVPQMQSLGMVEFWDQFESLIDS